MTIIEAKRWFQKTYGNTYHSVSVWKDGKLIGRNPFAYGYDRHFLVTAAKILKVTMPELMDQMRENPNEFHVNVSDVSRKKDL